MSARGHRDGGAAPDGFTVLRGPEGFAWAREPALSWAHQALSRGITLYEAASGGALPTTGGRGEVRRAGPAPPASGWVVRHGWRGGWMAPLLDDRYLAIGPNRVEAEARAQVALASAGVDTPRVLAVATYPAGAFRRHDLVTEWVEGDSLSTLLRRPPPDPASVHPDEALAAVARVIERIGRASLWHRDLNADNLLVDRLEGGSPRVWVLDLDRLTKAPPDRAIPAMRGRLARSFQKLGLDWTLPADGSEEANRSPPR